MDLDLLPTSDLYDLYDLPNLPPDSDPALLDFEEQLDHHILPTSTKSDEVEALYLVQEETRAKKNKDGEVIQHRAWKLAEAFRSEADYIHGRTWTHWTEIRFSNACHCVETPVRTKISKQQLFLIPSSPPSFKMPLVSSPIEYPQSSSPPAMKRPQPTKPSDLRRPQKVGGFLLDDGSDVEDEFEQPAAKRRMTEKPNYPQLVPEEDSQKDSANECDSGSFRNTTGAPKTVGGFLLDDDDEDEDSGVEISQDAQLPRSIPQPMIDLIRDSNVLSTLPAFLNKPKKAADLTTCSGKSFTINRRKEAEAVSFEKLVAARSTTKAGRAKKSYYGIDIHGLVEEAAKEKKAEEKRKAQAENVIITSIESPIGKKPRKSLMWTEKYRARHFMELVGDDRTHRQVLRWLKAWDPIVFPKSGKPKAVASKRPGEIDEEKPHRKILMLTGPPGLGKTTLAHVCARQAGYEVMEINASDERSRDVVKNRIRTSVGTENVKTGSTVTSKSGHVQKNAHPLCVVVDEVDGVVGGAGGSGEGGFIKALIDLIQLDQKNSGAVGTSTGYTKKKKKGDDFRLMRPVILICNDVYHPSLRPLRNSSFAEVIHIRKPPLDAVVNRMKSVFEKEGVACDGDAVRRLCEATWGISPLDAKKGAEGTGEGDLRSVMVVGEWAAGKLKMESKNSPPRLTRKWVEQNMTGDLSHGGGGTRAVGRGGAKEVVNRVFLEGAGFPRPTNFNNIISKDTHDSQPKTQLGVAELARKAAMDRLGSMIETSGDTDRIMTDIFGEYPNQPFNDDSTLSKPDAAYEWLHFHDTCSSRVFSGQEWELAGYLTQPILAWHNLFASPARHYFRNNNNEGKKWSNKNDPNAEEEVVEELPFSGPRADFSAHEAEKENRAMIQGLQGTLDAKLLRSFRSVEDIAMDLLPYVVRMLTPDIKPIVVGGSGEQKGIASVRKESEKRMVKRAADVMFEMGVVFERGRLEDTGGASKWGASEWVYRMEPPLDTLITFLTAPALTPATQVRYAVRQVLDQEYQKSILLRESAARQARYHAGGDGGEDDYDTSLAGKKGKKTEIGEEKDEVKRDFFGRVVLGRASGNTGQVGEETERGQERGKGKKKGGKKVWVTFHEGFSNAVRKPITVAELMRGL
ncbi:Chromosome transmission fidelity 18 protein [Rutstroemia sp. NJR-2017a WRK4]|nr:Chromosome transmission fidelity 18 protein [Rutstroemia sp. NJR-2017a WRK4]